MFLKTLMWTSLQILKIIIHLDDDSYLSYKRICNCGIDFSEQELCFKLYPCGTLWNSPDRVRSICMFQLQKYFSWILFVRLFGLSLIHISEPTRRTPISYAVFCLKKKKKIL